MKQKERKIVCICLIIIAIYFGIKLVDELLMITKFLFKLVFPILLGFFIAFILYPFKRYLRSKKLSNTLSSILSIVLLAIIIGLLFVIILPKLIKELSQFLEQIPSYMLYVEGILDNVSKKMLGNININQYIKKIFFDSLGNFSLKIIAVFQTIISYSISIIIAVFISIYLLFDYEDIIKKIKELINKTKSHKLYSFVWEVKDSIYTYLKGLLKANTILFIVSSLLFWFIGLEYFYIIALIFAITNVIPYLGPYIGGGFAVVISLNYSTNKALLTFFAVILLQFIDNYIVSPKIQSSNMNVKPVKIIISIFIMGSLFGIFGMILAVPIVSIIDNLIKHFIVKNDKS